MSFYSPNVCTAKVYPIFHLLSFFAQTKSIQNCVPPHYIATAKQTSSPEWGAFPPHPSKIQYNIVLLNTITFTYLLTYRGLTHTN